MLQNDDEITSKSKFWNQNVQFWYLHHLAYWPPSPCLLANHITLPGREIPGAGRVITLPKGHHPALSKSLILVALAAGANTPCELPHVLPSRCLDPHNRFLIDTRIQHWQHTLLPDSRLAHNGFTHCSLWLSCRSTLNAQWIHNGWWADSWWIHNRLIMN